MSEMAQRELPEGWTFKPIGEIVQPTRPRVSPAEKPDLPFLGMDHIEAQTMRLLGSVPASSMKSSAVHFQPGDVLYGRLRPYLNKVFQPTFEGLCSAEFIVFPETEELDNKYLQYFLNSSSFVRYATSLNSGDRPRVKFEQFSSHCIPLPPTVNDQKRIVAKIEELFSHIDAGVDELKKTQRLLKQYRQSVLKAAVTGELTKEWREENKDKLEPASELLNRVLVEKQKKAKGKYKEPEPLEEVPDIILPDTWQWVAIGQVFDVYVGATPSRKELKYWDGGINWVSSGEVAFCRIKKTKETITDDGLKNTSAELHPPGTVMLGMIGEGKTRGQAAILDIHAAHNQNTAAIVKCVDEMSSEYLYFYLMQQYEITRRRGSGNNQKALNKTRVQAIEFPLPSVQEQKEIVALAQEKLDSIERLESEISIFMKKAERNKQSFLSWSFQGKT
ncbi:MAG: restriction endonuclease subunit S [Gammaproteobacteria bacterium]|nr:restriction endonuclease subunit S [Gammaproteobacteria bacterium]MBU1724838.1 restriction endonuclease subunit S [Gammaproteobacteria bacterium]MBU2006499.1 restriction endonuclease subunit S [Gammaproteobacteria bacterium]